MILKCIKCELLKLKRSPVWVIFLLMPIIPAILGTLNYLNNLDLLTSGWYSLWTQDTLFLCYFFLPAAVGIYCSYLMRLEYANHNMNKLMSMPIHARAVFAGKFCSAAFMVVLNLIWISALFVAAGKCSGIEEAVPWADLLDWMLCGMAGGLVVVALQLCISLVIRSFALPVGIALAGGIVGLVALAKGFGMYFPYSLMQLGMRANSPQQLAPEEYATFFISCTVWLVVLFVIGIAYLKRHDVK